LGPDFFDQFFQLLDPEGETDPEVPPRGARALPLSSTARANARRGVPTFETVKLDPGELTRILTMPVMQGGRLERLVQLGIPLRRTREALSGHLRTLLALVPVGLGLAMAGGAPAARA